MYSVQPMGLGKTIREVRLAKGLTLEKLEELSGVAVGTISALETRDSARSQYFPQLAKALGVSMEQLTTPDLLWHDEQGKVYAVEFKAPAGDDHHAPYLSQYHRALEPDTSYTAPILAWEHQGELPEGGFVMIPRLWVRASPDGVRIDTDRQAAQLFRTEWIREMNVKPAKLAAMRAPDDSMAPTIYQGDDLLIDTADTAAADGRVYAIWYDGGERVKRLFRLPGGGLRIVSDNSKHPSIEVAAAQIEHVRVIGRVVHRSGAGGL